MKFPTLYHAFSETEVRMFVYGTLRRGGALESLLPYDCPRESVQVLDYALHYPCNHRSFPYLVPSHDARTLGELVRVPLEDPDAVYAFRYVDQMEQSAGYTCRPVVLGTGDAALAWVWLDADSVGPRIFEDDWTRTPEWVKVDRTALR